MTTIKPYKNLKNGIQNSDSDYAKDCQKMLRKMMTPKRMPKKQEIIINTIEKLEERLNLLR